MEWIRVEVAKSPVRRGRRDWFMLRFKDANPRNPDRINIMVAFIFDSFSFRIKRSAIQIRRKPIILWRSGYIFGMSRMKIGRIIVRDMIAIVEPMRVSFSALCPCPFSRSS